MILNSLFMMIAIMMAVIVRDDDHNNWLVVMIMMIKDDDDADEGTLTFASLLFNLQSPIKQWAIVELRNIYFESG